MSWQPNKQRTWPLCPRQTGVQWIHCCMCALMCVHAHAAHTPCFAHMKRLCRRAWQLCHILPAVAYFQHPFHSGKYPKSCCVFHTVLWKAIFFHTGLLFPSLPLSFSLISPPFSSHIFFPYLIPSSKSNHCRSGEIDFFHHDSPYAFIMSGLHDA